MKRINEDLSYTFVCEYCFEEFRYSKNLENHYKKCLNKQYGVTEE